MRSSLRMLDEGKKREVVEFLEEADEPLEREELVEGLGYDREEVRELVIDLLYDLRITATPDRRLEPPVSDY